MKEQEYVRSDVIETLWSKKVLTDPAFDSFDIGTNEYLVLVDEQDDNKVAHVRYLGNSTCKLTPTGISFQKVRGKDMGQHELFDSLNDDSIKIVGVTGPAGAGKTFLSIAWAVEQLMKTKETRIIFTKPTVTVGGAAFFGAVPGDVEDKFGIFLESYQNSIDKVLGDSDKTKTMIQTWIDKEVISFKPIQFSRGCNWDNAILIADECQNMTWHEIKTILSRLGENSKAVLLGDLKQKDVKTTGFDSFLASKGFSESPITSHVKLTKDYRGPISKLVGVIGEELNV